VASTYRLTRLRRAVNALVTPLARLGIAGKRTHILTLRGRTTGRRHSTPVELVIGEHDRWLVAPYGERAWVKNARAAGEVKLTRGRTSTSWRVEELDAGEAAPVLREYLRTTPVVRPYVDVGLDAPLEAFAAEAPRHPVFQLREVRR